MMNLSKYSARANLRNAAEVGETRKRPEGFVLYDRCGLPVFRISANCRSRRIRHIKCNTRSVRWMAQDMLLHFVYR